MSTKRMETEVKVGFFVSLGLVLIMLAILLLGSAENFLSRKTSYFIHVSNVEGLIQGAKVVLGGVSVGTVQDIKLDNDRRDIRVELAVSQDGASWIHQDATAEIATQGVLGDKFVSILPGNEKLPHLPEKSEIPFVPSKGLTQFLSKGDQLLVTLNSLSGNLDQMVRAFNTGNRSELFFRGMAETSRNLSSATEKINKQLDSLRINKVISNLESITDKINGGTGTVGALINDPSLYDSAKLLVGEANRNRIMRNLVRQTLRDSEDSAAKASDAKGTHK